MSRISTHVIETKSADIVRTIIDGYYPDGSALFREITERDYGVDGIIELFENGCPTGQLALVQIKGTEKTIVPLKRTLAVSCRISSSNVLYASQNNIPVIVLYVSLKNKIIYYHCLNNDSELFNCNFENGTVTIHIPIDNNSFDNFETLFNIIRDYYAR